MGDESDADWQEGLVEWAREAMDRAMEDAIFGGRRPKQRQTALRVRGRGFETVELDDAGNIIEPLRCTCGAIVVLMHRKGCPFEHYTGT